MDASKIENDLRKDRIIHDRLFSRFTKAIVKYELLSPGDKIAVCISGGKDSMLMGKLFQELKRHDKFPFELVYLVMDPGYDETVRKNIESVAERIGLPLTVFENRLFEVVSENETPLETLLLWPILRGHKAPGSTLS